MLSQLDNLLVPPMVIVELLCNYLTHFLKLALLTDLEVFDEVEGCCLVIRHVFIPSFGEFGVLYLLRLLNIDELPLLRNAHIVTLSFLFVVTPSVEDFLKLVSHHVVAHRLVALPDFIHDPVKWENKSVRKSNLKTIELINTYLRKATIRSSGRKYTPVFGSRAPYFFLSIS